MTRHEQRQFINDLVENPIYKMVAVEDFTLDRISIVLDCVSVLDEASMNLIFNISSNGIKDTKVIPIELGMNIIDSSISIKQGSILWIDVDYKPINNDNVNMKKFRLTIAFNKRVGS